MKDVESLECVRAAAQAVHDALRILGLAQNHQGLTAPELDLQATPERIVRMWLEMTEGLRVKPPEVTAFKTKHQGMLILDGIRFTSLCAHHFVPFRGVAHIGYIPNKKLVGISKPARVVDYFAARPQVQELLTQQILDYLVEKLSPQGVMVILTAEHMCVTCRGARKPGATFTTSAVQGLFFDNASVKEEFLALLAMRSE